MKSICQPIPCIDVNHKNDQKELSTIVFLGLILVFILEYFRPNNYLPFLNIIKLNTIVPIALFLVTFFSRKGPSINVIMKELNTKVLLFFIFLLSLSVLTADVTFYSFKIFTQVLGYCFVFFATRKLLTNIDRFRALFIFYAVTHIALVLLNPAVILNPENRNYLGNSPFLGDGNDFALSVCMVIPMVYFLVVNGKRKSIQTLFVLIFIFLCLCVIGTQSRGGTVALCVTSLYLWRKSKKKIIGFFFLAIILIVGLAYAPPQYFQRMDRIVNYEKDGSAQGRLLAWQSAIRMALDKPFLGVGSGHFSVKYGTDYRPPGYGRTDLPWQTAHSIYFLALGELGFPGLFVVLVLIILNFITVGKRIKTIRRATGLGRSQVEMLLISLNGSLLAYTVGGTFLSVLYYPYLYFLLGMIGCATQLAINNDEPTLEHKVDFSSKMIPHPNRIILNKQLSTQG